MIGNDLDDQLRAGGKVRRGRQEPDYSNEIGKRRMLCGENRRRGSLLSIYGNVRQMKNVLREFF